MANDYINVDEAHDLTGWTRSTLYSKISRRQIPSYRIGRSVRLKRSELLKLFVPRPALRPLHAPGNPSDGENGGER